MPDNSTAKKLVYILTGGIFVLIAMFMFAPIPDGNKTMIDSISMAVLTAWVGAVGYFLGGSASPAPKPDPAGADAPKPTE